LRVISRYLG